MPILQASLNWILPSLAPTPRYKAGANAIPLIGGTVQAQAFASGVSSDIHGGADTLIAVFDAEFSETTLVIKSADNRLKVDSYDRLKDNSNRSNYLASYTIQNVQDLGVPTPGVATPSGFTPGDTSPSGVINGSVPI